MCVYTSMCIYIYVCIQIDRCSQCTYTLYIYTYIHTHTHPTYIVHTVTCRKVYVRPSVELSCSRRLKSRPVQARLVGCGGGFIQRRAQRAVLSKN